VTAKDQYTPAKYWTNVAQSYGGSDTTGFAPVLHPGAPEWYNRTIDTVQSQAVSRALELAELKAGARILDVGCGTGRWLRRYAEIGLVPTGLDATPPMLALARKNATTAPLTAGECFRLPFADASFDAVSDITVVQHVPPASQPAALTEMLRVLKPNGKLILMEMIRGEGLHTFPLTPQGWIKETVSRGATLIGWFGEEFMLIDRAFVKLALTISGRQNQQAQNFGKQEATEAASGSAAKSAYWAMRRVTAPLSAWTDRATSKLVPGEMATHGVFVFKKDVAAAA
jgi:ubiquinone/menaquinone biosynthesis C-methylase UbiE